MARVNIQQQVVQYNTNVKYYKAEITRIETIQLQRKQMGLEVPLTIINQLRTLYKRLIVTMETLEAMK